jgi:hypothetical protein
VSDLPEAIHFHQKIFLQEKSFWQIPSEKLPTRFIPEKYKRYLYRASKGSKRKQIIPDRYEFLVYRL